MLGEGNYTLEIRPTFIDELDATVRYIEQELRNPKAADRLIERTYAAIDERLFAPASFEPCYRFRYSRSVRPLSEMRCPPSEKSKM